MKEHTWHLPTWINSLKREIIPLCRGNGERESQKIVSTKMLAILAIAKFHNHQGSQSDYICNLNCT
jgi:hypothetical protein